ncbi:MAG: response regulator [Chitinispirillaceae bacterium]|nr:response regulator [Chitinispirillaceae bacterium]
MSERGKGTILVVDDEPEIRQMIVDYLRDVEGYAVRDTVDGPGALELLAATPVDLVLSDINMPGMRGFDLLRLVKERYPVIKRVLITAYNVEDYLELAQNYDIGNIFVKTAPFNFNELSVIIKNLLSNDIFGLEQHFEAGATKNDFLIKTARHLDSHARVITELIGDYKRAKRLEVVIVELLTNAIFYGIRSESPERKDEWDVDCELPDEKAIVVTVMRDPEKYGISVLDKGGRLKKSDVLYWMNRQIARDTSGLPIGLLDGHGRGLFIARRYIDRLIVNLQNNVQTEIVIINYFDKTFYGFKPLYINEL